MNRTISLWDQNYGCIVWDETKMSSLIVLVIAAGTPSPQLSLITIFNLDAAQVITIPTPSRVRVRRRKLLFGNKKLMNKGNYFRWLQTKYYDAFSIKNIVLESKEFEC